MAKRGNTLEWEMTKRGNMLKWERIDKVSDDGAKSTQDVTKNLMDHTMYFNRGLENI